MNKENIEQILNSLGAEQIPADVHKIALEASNSFTKTLTQTKPTKRRILLGFFIESRIAKLAVAAAIVIIVLCGLTFWPTAGSRNAKWWLGPSTVWGQEILAVLDTVKGVTCREQSFIILADGTTTTSATWDKLYVSRDSYRRDIYDGSVFHEIQWYVPDGNDMIQHYVRFDLRCYGALRHGGSFGRYDPVERMRFYVGLLDKADKFLGEKVFDGRRCVGFEISAGKYGNNPEQWLDCIWFDVETKLPVCIEERGRPITDNPDKTFTKIKDQFDYNPQLSPDTFVPFVPQGFINAHPDQMKDQQEHQNQ